MEVEITTVDHAAQRYDTCGDWFWFNELLYIRVSRLGDRRYEALLALHELVEALLCNLAGVSEESVTDFDLKWASGDRDKYSKATGEPGDDHRAPYHHQHRCASMIEMLVAHEMRVNWRAYCEALEELVRDEASTTHFG